MFLAEVRKLERDETRGQRHKKAFRGGTEDKVDGSGHEENSVDSGYIEKGGCTCVRVGGRGEKDKSSPVFAWRNWVDGVSFTEIRNIF